MTAVFAGQWGPEAAITKAGDALPGASVSLYDADGVTPSTVWTGRTKAATRATPFTPDANGNISFFAEPGAHVLAVTVGVAVTRLPITVPVDPAEDQPLDGDLAAIAALSTTPYGRGFLVQTDAAAARGTLGLGTAATADTTAFDAAGAAASQAAAAVAALVNSAPSTLDTLAEIATALGNDPNLATTLTAAIGTKAAQTALNTEIAARAAGDALNVPLTQRGAANGVATLDGGSKIPDGQIPDGITRDTELTAAVAALVNAAPTTLDTLAEIATALGSDPNLATTLTNAIALKAALAGATFTGDVQVPDAAYDATTWDGSAKVPTRNAVRDALVSLFAAEVTRGNAAYAAGTSTTVITGVDTTGVTEATAIIQAALTAAVDGDVIVLPRGTLLVGNLTCTKNVRITGQGSGATTLKAKAGTTGTLLTLAPTTRAFGHRGGGYTIDLTLCPTIIGLGITTSMAIPILDDVRILYGSVGLDVASASGGRFGLGGVIVCRNQTTAGIRVNQDLGGDNYFAYDIAPTDPAVTMAAGFELVRTTATDTGGLYLDGRVVAGGGTLTKGYYLHSSAPACLNPVFFKEGCVADSFHGGYGAHLVNLVDVQMVNGWLAGTANSYAMLIDGCQFVKVVASKIQADLGGFAFANASSSLQFIGNHADGGGAMFVIPAGSGDRPLGLFVSGNKPYSVLTDDYTNFALAANTASDLAGIQVLTHGGGSKTQSFTLRNADGGGKPTKSFRVNSAGTLQIIDDSFTNVLLSLSDSGGLSTLLGTALLGKTLPLPTWAATTAYNSGQFFTYLGNVWLVTSAFTSGATFDPSTNLQLIAGGGLGFPHTIDPGVLRGTDALSVGTANNGIYFRCRDGGTISKVGIHPAVSSGNISIAGYRNAGAGRSAQPTDSRIFTTGAIACPSAVYTEVALGASYVLSPGDWLAISADNTTATFHAGLSSDLATSLGLGRQFVQATAHPLPSTPSSLAAHIGNNICLVGVA